MFTLPPIIDWVRKEMFGSHRELKQTVFGYPVNGVYTWQYSSDIFALVLSQQFAHPFMWIWWLCYMSPMWPQRLSCVIKVQITHIVKMISTRRFCTSTCQHSVSPSVVPFLKVGVVNGHKTVAFIQKTGVCRNHNRSLTLTIPRFPCLNYCRGLQF